MAVSFKHMTYKAEHKPKVLSYKREPRQNVRKTRSVFRYFGVVAS